MQPIFLIVNWRSSRPPPGTISITLIRKEFGPFPAGSRIFQASVGRVFDAIYEVVADQEREMDNDSEGGRPAGRDAYDDGRRFSGLP